MTDFINVSELPVLESYSEGDTTLVLHEDKLYQCPEGGGGSYNTAINLEYDGDSVNSRVFIDDDVFSEFKAAIEANKSMVITVNIIDEETKEPVIPSFTMYGVGCVIIPAEIIEPLLGVPTDMIVIAYNGMLPVSDEGLYMERIEEIMVMPEPAV